MREALFTIVICIQRMLTTMNATTHPVSEFYVTHFDLQDFNGEEGPHFTMLPPSGAAQYCLHACQHSGSR